MAGLAYPVFVYLHLMLFVFWLGADAGVFLISRHFRKRDTYDLPQRLALLRMLVVIDMVPRTAWALMVPVSLAVVALGGWWGAPAWVIALSWGVAAVWLFLIWDAHLHDDTARAVRNRRIELVLKIALAMFYLGLGVISIETGAPLAVGWLAWKALLFGLIFVAAIMIDVRFEPDQVGTMQVWLAANRKPLTETWHYAWRDYGF